MIGPKVNIGPLDRIIASNIQYPDIRMFGFQGYAVIPYATKHPQFIIRAATPQCGDIGTIGILGLIYQQTFAAFGIVDFVITISLIGEFPYLGFVESFFSQRYIISIVRNVSPLCGIDNIRVEVATYIHTLNIIAGMVNPGQMIANTIFPCNNLSATTGFANPKCIGLRIQPLIGFRHVAFPVSLCAVQQIVFRCGVISVVDKCACGYVYRFVSGRIRRPRTFDLAPTIGIHFAYQAAVIYINLTDRTRFITRPVVACYLFGGIYISVESRVTGING